MADDHVQIVFLIINEDNKPLNIAQHHSSDTQNVNFSAISRSSPLNCKAFLKLLFLSLSCFVAYCVDLTFLMQSLKGLGAPASFLSWTREILSTEFPLLDVAENYTSCRSSISSSFKAFSSSSSRVTIFLSLLSPN